MNEADRRGILKKLGVAVWALFTLVLVFCVVLLTREIVQEGGNPFESFQAPAAGPAETPAPARENTMGAAQNVPLYFASADGRILIPETCRLDIGDSTVENCRQALQKLIAGPHNPLTPVLPPSVKVRALYLLPEGELVVDFSGEILSEQMRFKSASLEALMAYAVVNTLTQPGLQAKQDPPVRSVRFLFEGAPPQEAFPAHVDLDAPLAPDPRWIESAQEAAAHG